ncbi:MAG: hypothetical protein E6G42_09775 [Actinobacteria bacterium]|nr:MAG: hypothetical protein E6G42_09775 [Actinomycetota bacterium]
MATTSPTVARAAELGRRGRFRPGDATLHGVTLAAAVSAVALLFLIAWKVIVSIAIALFLTELAPRWLRGPVGALVEMLAAVPSVVVGLWGILVLGPFVQGHVEPWLKRTLGFLPLFRGDPSIFGLLPAILVLTIMITPIVSSVSRELFLGVPREPSARRSPSPR